MKKFCVPVLWGILSLTLFAHENSSPSPGFNPGLLAQDKAASWSSLGPYGGDIRAMAVSSQNPSQIWALSVTNPSLIGKTTDGGATWNIASVSAECFYDLKIHPVTGVLYGLSDTALYKSSNGGTTWTKFKLGTNQHGFWGRLALHPSNPDIVYIGGYYQNASSKNNMAFFKSADGGTTWSVKTFEDASSDGLLNGIAVSRSSPNVIYALGYFTDSQGRFNVRIYKSVNDGVSWIGQSNPEDRLFRDIVVHPTDPNKAYLVTEYHVWRTSNGGNTWTPNNGSAGGYVLALDPSYPDTLYAGYYNTVYRSLNGGADWEQSTSGVYGDVFAITVLTDKVLCGSLAGIFATQSGAGTGLTSWPTWTDSSNGLKAATLKCFAVAPSSPNTLYAAVYARGVFISKDSGSTWAMLPYSSASSFFSRLEVHPSHANIVYGLFYVSGEDSLFKTADGGKTWTKLVSAECEDFVLSQKNPGRIFIAGTSSVGSQYYMALHRSTDGGAKWTHIKISSTAGSCGYAIALDPKNDNVVYVGGTSAGGGAALFKSSDMGKKWTNITGDIQGKIVDIAVDPTTSDRIYVASMGGLFKSENGGSTWKAVRNDSICCLFVHPTSPKIVYAVQNSGKGIFVSKNYGATWSSFNQGLIYKIVVALGLDKKTDTLYAATYGASVWKRKI